MRLAAKLSLCLQFVPVLFLGSPLPVEDSRRSGSAQIVNDPARSRQLEGTVEALYADDFDTGGSERVYHLLTAEGERLPLAFPQGPARTYRTGEHLLIRGRMNDDGRLAVESAEASPGLSAESAGLALSSWSTGPKRVLLIRYNFHDDTSQPYSDATSQNVMFGAAGSVAAFYAESSYGVTTQTGSITPWVTVSTNKPTTCDISAYTDATTLAKAAGYDSSTYDFTVYVFPHIPCGWAGLGVVGGSGAWINQALSTYVVAHEVGHNYGLMHAHSRSCSGLSIGPSCTESEYGDPFDTMGGSNHQFNAFHKNELAWLTGASIATRSSGSGTYTLSPLESGSGLRALQLTTNDSSRTYWVEFRQAIGFDAGLSGNANVMNGVLIHIGPSADWGSDLLDMLPGTATFSDAALDVGDAFTDSSVGLTITTLSKTANTIVVRVDFGPVVPIASFYFSPTSPNFGQPVQFTDTSSGSPTVWTWAFGDGGVSTVQNPTHIYAAPGVYTATLTAGNAQGSSAPVLRQVTVAVPTISSLVASPAPPRPAGTAMTWTATATGGVAPLQYRFWRYSGSGGWTIAQDYSTSNTLAWTPWQPGQYDIAVWVKSAGSPNAYDAVRDTGFFNITANVTISNLSASPAPPRPVGTVMKWTAAASGGPAPLLYRFWRYNVSTGWVMVQDYTTTNTYSWTPAVPGQYDIAVWVKATGSPNAYDAVRDAGMFTITSTVTISALSASPSPPRAAGTPFTWTATASGPAPLQYRFWQYSPAGGWVMVRDYATSNTFTWTPAAAGQYDIAIWVKGAGSANAFDAVRDSGTFTITP
jgi:PKD repeat protein